MLARANRLGRAEFKTLTGASRSIHSRHFILRFKKNAVVAARFVLVVSTKAAKLATVRNKLKRRTRHLIKNRLAEIPKGYDYWLFFKAGAGTVSFRELNQELTAVFRRLSEH